MFALPDLPPVRRTVVARGFSPWKTGRFSLSRPAGRANIGHNARVMTTPNPIEPRPVEPADIPGIHALIAAIYADYDYVLDVEVEDAHLRDPGAYFRCTGGEFWVVSDAGRIVATGAALLHPDCGEIKSVYVHRAIRRRGWGRRLTNLALAHIRAAGRRRAILWSDTRFTEAHRLYEALGFRRTGRREIHCTNSFAEYGYELELPA